MNQEIRKRDGRIDFLKGIGILLVIIGHLSCPNWMKSYIYLFHMPMFFFISGYNFDCRMPMSEFFIKKCKTILYPYFMFGAVYIVFEYTINLISRDNVGGVFWKKHIIALCYGNYIYENNADYIGVLWFLVCLFVVSFCYRLITAVILSRKKRLLFCITLSIFGNVLGQFLFIPRGVRLPWCLDIAPAAMACIAIGDYYRGTLHKKYSVKNGISALLVGTLIGVGNILVLHKMGCGIRLDMLTLKFGSSILFFASAASISYALVCFTVLLYSSGRHLSCVEKIGRESMLIMIVHLKILKVMEICTNYIGIHMRWEFLLVLLVLSSYAAALLIKKYLVFLVRLRN